MPCVYFNIVNVKFKSSENLNTALSMQTFSCYMVINGQMLVGYYMYYVQVRRIGSLLVFFINGGWTFPGVEYIWKRVKQELKTCNNDDSG